MHGPPEHTTTYVYPAYNDYAKFSEVENNSANMTVYDYSSINITQITTKLNISGDTLIFGDEKFNYKINGNILKLESSLTTISNCGPDSGNIHTVGRVYTYYKISSLPESGGGNNGGSGGGNGSGCTLVQCSSYTQAGNRCQRNTTNCNGRCWQHQ